MIRSKFTVSSDTHYISSNQSNRSITITVDSVGQKKFRVAVRGMNIDINDTRENTVFWYPSKTTYQTLPDDAHYWAIPLDKMLLSQYAPQSSSGVIKITLITYTTAGQRIGDYTLNVTCSLLAEPYALKDYTFAIEPYSFLPKASAFAAAEGIFLENITGITATIANTTYTEPWHVSYPTSIMTTFGKRQSYTTRQDEPHVIKTATLTRDAYIDGSGGTLALQSDVTNQRGLVLAKHPTFNGTEVSSVYLAEWSRPTLTVASYTRSRKDANLDTITVNASSTYQSTVQGESASIDLSDYPGLDTPRITCRYRVKDSTSDYTTVPITAGQAQIDVDKSYSYEIIVTAYDYFGDTASVAFTMPTAQCDFAMKNGRVCIGGFTDSSLPTPSFHCRPEAYFDDAVYIKDNGQYVDLITYIHNHQN